MDYQILEIIFMFAVLQEKSFHAILSTIDQLRHRKKNRLDQKKKKNYAQIVSNTILHCQINRKHYTLLQKNSTYIDYDNFLRDMISIIFIQILYNNCELKKFLINRSYKSYKSIDISSKLLHFNIWEMNN